MKTGEKIMKTIFLLIAFHCAIQYSLAYDLHFLNDVETTMGLGWPNVINVIEGNEVLLKLRKTLENQNTCSITTPEGVTFDIRTPPNPRFELWDGCGVRVKDIEKSDEGRWRLTSTGGDHTVTGFSEVYVQNQTHFEPPSPIYLQDGHENQHVDLSAVPNLYCMVTQPFTESTLVPGDCQVHLEKTTRAVQGNWVISFGVPGQVAEVTMDRHVAVEAERLVVGYVPDTTSNKLHLHCNIVHSTKEITFCRFQRTSSTSGFNLLDGLSDGQHSYYGKGFALKECGMTIEHPEAADFSSWRCSVGTQELVGTSYVQRAPMQALIAVARSRQVSAAQQARNTESHPTVFVERNQEMTITCNSDFPLTYCWFQAPDRAQYTPVAATSVDQEFWYQGESLEFGDCGIVFAHAHDNFTGQWTCHKGASDLLGVEETDQVQVRVTGALAAREFNVEVEIGDTIELHCHTANGNRPLNYCRFLTPYNLGMNVDPTVTEDLAVLNRYYFTPEKNLDYGDCALTIKDVTEQDLGTWTCAALLIDETVESRDTISVFVSETYIQAQRSRAGIAGGIFSGFAVLFLIAGFTWYKRGRPVPWNNLHSTNTSQIPMTDMSTRTSVSSGNSSSGSERTV